MSYTCHHSRNCSWSLAVPHNQAFKEAFAKVFLRIPDPNKFELTNSQKGDHSLTCFSFGHDGELDETNVRLYRIERLQLLLMRCISVIGENIADMVYRLTNNNSSWFVQKYVPGESLQICIVVPLISILVNPVQKLKMLAKLGEAATLVRPLFRFGRPVTFESLRQFFNVAHPNELVHSVSDFLRGIETQHSVVLDAVKHFIDTGDQAAYAAATCESFSLAYPTIESLQEAIDASSRFTIVLKPYQLATIAWALDREKHGSLADVLQLDCPSEKFVYKLSHDWGTWTCDTVPYSEDSRKIRGGMLLDEMGMGKTIEMLGVILASQNHEDETPESSEVVGPIFPTLKRERAVEYHRGTLIVVPLSMMHQWADEIAVKVADAPGVVQYHGSSRSRAKIMDASIVLTTYETISADSRFARTNSRVTALQNSTTWTCPSVPFIDQRDVPVQPVAGAVFRNSRYPGKLIYIKKIETSGREVGFLFDDSLQFMHARSYSHFTNIVSTTEYLSTYQTSSRMFVGTLKECKRVHASVLGACSVCRYNPFPAFESAVDDVLVPPLERILWERVVTDESHRLSSTNSDQFRSLMRISGCKKWCLTGTPMPKCVSDLFGQIKWMQLGKTFTRHNFSVSVGSGVSDIMCRHTKKHCLLYDAGVTVLPPMHSHEVLVNVSDEDRKTYETHAAKTRDYYHRHQMDQRFMARVFQFLTTQRRACTIIDTGVVRHRARAEETLPPLPEEALHGDEDCPICMEAPPHPVMLPCRHCFCHECLMTLFETTVKCSLCQRPLTNDELADVRKKCRQISAVLTIPVDLETEHGRVFGTEKFAAMLQILRAEPPEPTLIFTQFDDCVQSLRKMLTTYGFTCVNTLTGSMGRSAREASLKAFRAGPPDGVLIMSLRTAAVGLNLTHASKVIFAEPSMNTGLEQQACGRVHRMGQTRPVNVYYLIAKDTIETKIRNFRDVETFRSTTNTNVIINDVQHKLMRRNQILMLMT